MEPTKTRDSEHTDAVFQTCQPVRELGESKALPFKGLVAIGESIISQDQREDSRASVSGETVAPEIEVTPFHGLPVFEHVSWTSVRKKRVIRDIFTFNCVCPTHFSVDKTQ